MRRVIDHDLPGFVAKLAEVLELQGIKLSPVLRKEAAADRRAYFDRQRRLAREESKSERAIARSRRDAQLAFERGFRDAKRERGE